VISRRQAAIATVPPDPTQISNQEQQQFHTLAPLERGEKGRGNRCIAELISSEDPCQPVSEDTYFLGCLRWRLTCDY